MNVLITGAAGYIGTHLVEHLIQKEHHVYAYDMMHKHDILNLTKLSQAARWADVVIHLAAVSSITACEATPLTAYETNVRGALNVKRATGKYRRTIFASSLAAGSPTCLYAQTKAVMEPHFTCSLRIGNVVGGLHKSKTHVVPALVRAAEEQALFYMTTESWTQRHYVNVYDVCTVIELMMYTGEGVYDCVGLEDPISLRDVIETVKTVTGKSIRVEQGATRAGEMPRPRSGGDRAQPGGRHADCRRI